MNQLVIEAPPGLRPRLSLFLSVGLLAGAIVALQIVIMRIFAVGSWAHFGSLVVSLAMLGFGLASVIISVGRPWFETHWRGSAGVALLLVGPLAVAANLIAQMVPFNAIFLVSDPDQKWRLLANFLLYLMPFLSGAFYLGIIFLRAGEGFGRVYFADLTGSGLASVVVLAAMYLLPPEHLLTVPLVLWAAAALCWFGMERNRRMLIASAVIAVLSVAAYNTLPSLTGVPDIAVSQYKGVAYARNFPDGHQIYRNISPFGDLQIYGSSYMHFAPGLSDNAAFNIPEPPPNTYVGMYVDGDGPDGIMRELPAADATYFKYLPMYYPYVIKTNPKTFVVQFGGGISTVTALNSGAQSVTVAENNPAVLQAFRDPSLKDATGDVLADPRVKVIDYDGRLYLAHTSDRYDVIDLSLADSTGLSNPGGFSITEKYAYTTEAMLNYMHALADGGVLSVTLWDKEEPPKSVLKLYSTIAAAAKQFDPQNAANSIFATSTYLSTTTVLFKRGGFTADEVAALRKHTASMSFDELYSPGFTYDQTAETGLLAQYQDSIFGNGDDPTLDPNAAASNASDASSDPTLDNLDSTDSTAADAAPTALPSTTLERMFWRAEFDGGSEDVADKYVFDSHPLTNDRPYFAAYVKTPDLTKTLDRLDLFQDDWGYLLVWATLGIAAITAASLVLLPVLFGWRVAFSGTPGKLGTIIYFACLGIGYIMVEVGLISRFNLALTNPTISASILIGGMLVFSGLGSLAAERFVNRARFVLPLVLAAVVVILAVYVLLLNTVLDTIGAYPYALRLLCCFALTAPPAFLMGFPMATAMTWLARLGKGHMFVWAWGINGCFSVVGAAAVPLIATSFGLSAVLELSAAAYLVAIPAFFAVMLPARQPIFKVAS